MSIISSLAVLSLAASSVSAVSLSSSCLGSLTTLLSSDGPASQCFASDSLVKFIPLAVTNTNASVVQTVDNYLQAVCPALICSNDTVTATANTLLGGCGEVFAAANIKNETVNAWIPFLPQIKSVACVQTSNSTEAYNSTVRWTMGASGNTNLTSSSNSTSNSSSYCLSSTLATLEHISNQTLDFTTISSLVTGTKSLSSFINTTALQNASALLCTDCTKGLYTQLISLGNNTAFMSATNTSIVSTVTKFVTEVCGAEFIDSTTPSTITNGSNPDAVPAAIEASTGAASSLCSLSPVAAVLAAAGVVGAMMV